MSNENKPTRPKANFDKLNLFRLNFLIILNKLTPESLNLLIPGYDKYIRNQKLHQLKMPVEDRVRQANFNKKYNLPQF
ncbi:MAG: hypothetical protein AAB705_03560 [Patescibacteria group bacterium]